MENFPKCIQYNIWSSFLLILKSLYPSDYSSSHYLCMATRGMLKASIDIYAYLKNVDWRNHEEVFWENA